MRTSPDAKSVAADGAAAIAAAKSSPPQIATLILPADTAWNEADGIAVARPGAVPFAAIERLVDEMVTVSEESISRALVLLLERAKLVVEPAGAVAVAAILDRPEHYATPAVAVLSGGNVDPLLLSKLIRHGLASAGRYLNIAVRIPDRPGGLARLLGELADCGANVSVCTISQSLRARMIVGSTKLPLTTLSPHSTVPPALRAAAIAAR